MIDKIKCWLGWHDYYFVKHDRIFEAKKKCVCCGKIKNC